MVTFAKCRVRLDGDGHHYIIHNNIHIQLNKTPGHIKWYPLNFKREDVK